MSPEDGMKKHDPALWFVGLGFLVIVAALGWWVWLVPGPLSVGALGAFILWAGVAGGE